MKKWIFLILSVFSLLAQATDQIIITVSNTQELESALSKLKNNTTIFLGAGTYNANLTFKNKKNIYLVGSSRAPTILKGTQAPPKKVRLIRSDKPICIDKPYNDICTWDSSLEWLPVYTKNTHATATVQIDNSYNVHVNNLRFINSQPSHISIINSQNILIKANHFYGGTFAVHASGETTHNITISNSTWKQDETIEQEMWNYLDWRHLHHGKFSYMNGAFFKSYNIKGAVYILHNKIRDAFNAIRMVAKVDECISKNCINTLNKDVIIRNNEFLYIRDNSVEPEHIVNGTWLIERNLFHSHADISLDSVHNPNHNSEFIIRNNVFSKNYQPSLKSVLPFSTERYNGGKVLKLPKNLRKLPTENGDSQQKLAPYLNIIFSENTVDLIHEDQEAPHNVSFLKGFLPIGTDIRNWNNNHSNLCVMKLTQGPNPATQKQICRTLGFF